MSKSQNVLSNFFWRLLERVGAQGVAFIISIVLARLLNPAVYGTVALVNVFMIILQVFVDSGLGNALIQKKDADDLDFSSVFYFNIVVCLFLYGAMFIAAPAIAGFYNVPELTSVVRVMSLTLIISGVKNVQQAYVSRNLLFKKFFYATLGGTIGAAFIGIWMAWRGYGVWALVIQNLFNGAVDTIILWLTVNWRPKWMFSFTRLKTLFSYGWKLLVSALIDTTYRELSQMIIGKLYTSENLAFYNKGDQLPKLAVININTAIDSVLFPVMSKEQEKRDRVRAMTRRAIKVSVYVIAPIMAGLAVCAKPLIGLLLTEKWLPCVFFLRIFCFSYAFWPIHTANLNAIKALGRSDLFLKIEIIKKVVGLIAIFSTMWISVEAMALSLIFTSISSQIINSWPNKKLLNYGYIDQIKDILPGIFLAVAMGCCIYPIQWLGLPDIVTLCIQVPLGAVIYIAGSKLFKLESFEYLWNLIKPVLIKFFRNKNDAKK